MAPHDGLTNKLTVVFLVDQNPPKRILVFKRSSDRDFAPNMYTGIGGKIEVGETELEGALRELNEETGISGILLKEFGRVIIDNNVRLYYFWGVYAGGELPKSDVGKLEWVNTEDLLKKEMISTTLLFCKEWEKRKFAVDQPFTVFEKEIEWDTAKKVRINELVEIKEGLL